MQITPPQDGSTCQLQGAIVVETGADVATADMSAVLSLVTLAGVTTPTEVGEIVESDSIRILSARASITPP